MIRLVLMDEEDVEYRSFETLIVSHDAFKSSSVMLCIFHAIWQPFKKDIYLVLPRKLGPDKPVELTDVGRTWGTSLVNISVPFIINSFDSSCIVSSQLQLNSYMEYFNIKLVSIEHAISISGHTIY